MYCSGSDDYLRRIRRRQYGTSFSSKGSHIMRLKLLAMASAIAGGLGFASTVDAAPLVVPPAITVVGDAVTTNVNYYGYGPGYGYYRPRPFYRPYGFYGPRRVYGPRFGYYRPRVFYRPAYFYGGPGYY